jgi:glycosyltransferase involved in cell wall biosynthesis
VAGFQADRPPLILWNHRWEYDKNPEEFFRALYYLQEQAVAFEVAVLGESYHQLPQVFAAAKKRLAERILHWGYVETFSDYARWLWRADILPVTSIHDFFGVSVVQAIYCGCQPLLPQRLAYPEHIEAEYHAQCFYTDFNDLVARLSQACQAFERTSHSQLSSSVYRYDWVRMAAIYDDLLGNLAAKA